MDKLIITVAPVGAEVTRNENPYLPLTASEIAEEAAICEKKGASIIHLHVRDSQGNATQNTKIFKEAIREIKKHTNLIIQISTGGASWMTVEERIQPIKLKPDMATLTTGSVNFGNEIFLNSSISIETFARAILMNGIKPEIEIFEVGMIQNALNLVKKGILKLPLHFNFVLGVPGGIPGTPKHLIHLIETIPMDCTWTVSGIGRVELPLAVMGIILGGNIRVGFEDNIYYNKGTLAKSNSELVERVARISTELNRPIATPDEARKILKLQQ